MDGKIATTALFIKGNEVIEYLVPDQSAQHKSIDLKLEIVYEDQHLAVINKPAGISVSGNKYYTIDNALSDHVSKSNLPDAVRPRPVHRLDSPTTGVLLIGKTASSIRSLNKLFESKKIEKKYLAVTYGTIPPSGEINTPIDGKESCSNFNTKHSVYSERFQQLNLVELSPQTGRKHQLRIHLSRLGSPILGDKEYGIKDLILKGKGLYLHAYSIHFIHPFTREELTIKIDPPSKFFKLFPIKNDTSSSSNIL